MEEEYAHEKGKNTFVYVGFDLEFSLGYCVEQFHFSVNYLNLPLLKTKVALHSSPKN